MGFDRIFLYLCLREYIIVIQSILSGTLECNYVRNKKICVSNQSLYWRKIVVWECSSHICTTEIVSMLNILEIHSIFIESPVS